MEPDHIELEDLSIFDIKNIKANCLIHINGRNETGKITFFRHFINTLYFDDCYCFTAYVDIENVDRMYLQNKFNKINLALWRNW